MKHFTIEELSRSDKAKRMGMSNVPPKEQEENLVALVDSVLDPLREAYGSPIHVNSGYRSVGLNELIKGAKNSQHCFDSETEVLTTSGWKKYNEIQEVDELFSYNMDKDIIEVTPIDDIIIRDYEGEMINIVNRNIDLMVTDGHRMVVRTATHKYQRKTNKELSEKEIEYFNSLKTDNDKFHIERAKDIFQKRRIFKCASKYDGETEIELNFAKFCLAFISDGYWQFKHSKKTSTVGIGFRLKKQRKMDILNYLFESMGWHYTVHKDDSGVYNYYIRSCYAQKVMDIVGKEKTIPLSFLEIGSEKMRELIYFYSHFDGSRDKRDNCTGLCLFSSYKENADILQTMCTLSGMRNSMSIRPESTYKIAGCEGISKESYTISIAPETNETKVSEIGFSKSSYKGKVWCVNNRNKTLIVRRNGKVSIQGNCKGEAADITTGSTTDNEKLFNMIIELQLPFDQLINENNFSWLHISHKSKGRNRKQILHL